MDIQESEGQVAAQQVNGLKFQLQDELASVNVPTIDEAYEYALRLTSN